MLQVDAVDLPSTSHKGLKTQVLTLSPYSCHRSFWTLSSAARSTLLQGLPDSACQRRLSLHCEEQFTLNAVSRSSSFLSQVKNSLNAPTWCRRVGPSNLSPKILHKKEHIQQENLFFSSSLYPQLSKLALSSSPFLFIPIFCISQSSYTMRLQGRKQPTAESSTSAKSAFFPLYHPALPRGFPLLFWFLCSWVTRKRYWVCLRQLCVS